MKTIHFHFSSRPFSCLEYIFNQSSTPSWVTLPPLPADVWKNEFLELLFFEWNKEKDHRLITWLERHSTEEMTTSIMAVEGEALNSDKKAAITTVLRVT